MIKGNGFTFALTGGGESVKSYIDATLKPFLIDKKIIDWDKHQRIGNGLLSLSAIDIAVN